MMTNEDMMNAMGRLPMVDLMLESKITDPIGSGTAYKASTVVRLLAEERERCAKICEIISYQCADEIRALK